MSNTRHINTLYENYSTNTIKGLVIPKEQFKKIIGKFSILVADKLMDAEEVKLPIIGTLRIKKIKQKYKDNKLKIDFNATKLAGKTIFHTNDHRDGYFYRLVWRRNKIKGNRLYSFIPERYHIKRRLAKILKTDFTKDFFLN